MNIFLRLWFFWIHVFCVFYLLKVAEKTGFSSSVVINWPFSWGWTDFLGIRSVWNAQRNNVTTGKNTISNAEFKGLIPHYWWLLKIYYIVIFGQVILKYYCSVAIMAFHAKKPKKNQWRTILFLYSRLSYYINLNILNYKCKHGIHPHTQVKSLDIIYSCRSDELKSIAGFRLLWAVWLL